MLFVRFTQIGRQRHQRLNLRNRNLILARAGTDSQHSVFSVTASLNLVSCPATETCGDGIPRRQISTLLPNHCRGAWHTRRRHLHLDAPPHVPSGKLSRIIAFAASRRSVLSRPYFRLTMYVRQAINQSTRTILRALANTRNR